MSVVGSVSTPTSKIGPGQLLVIHALFFGSGVASLICQVLWFKQLQFVLGSSTFSVTITVASFFLGLAGGSWLGGRWADRLSRPLRAYGLLECALAAVSLGITVLLSTWETWAVMLAGSVGVDSFLAKAIAVLVSFGVLLPPTLLMGATLPTLARYLVREQQALAQRIGVLYGVNTLGAAFGCALVGFVMIGTLGVFQSSLVAAGIYLAIGLAGIAMSATVERGTGSAAENSASPAAVPAESSTPAETQGILALTLVFALSGFISIAYEVVWFRVLANMGLHSVYVFSAMLSTYLLGLVLGAWICARWLAPNKQMLTRYFAQIQLLIALGGMLTLAMLGRAKIFALFFTQLPASLGIPLPESATLRTVIGLVPCFFLILVIPTTLIGIGFPLASELTIQRLSVLGRRLGGLYALNTIGGVLGSLVAGFILLPWLGSQGSLTLLIFGSLALYVLVVATQPGLRQDRVLWRQGAIAAVVFAAGTFGLGSHYLERSMTNFLDCEVLAFDESANGTVVVLGYDSRASGKFQQMVFNGTSYASNSPAGRCYMGMLAHLPLLLHKEPKTALVICVGTGTTIGDTTVHPSLEKIYAVDLAQQAFDFAPYFVPLNHSFYEHPKVRKVVADGRHFLLSTPENFDVLTFEPPPPNNAGVVNLYSEEFYAVAKRRMPKGAILAQWIPLNTTGGAPQMMLRAMLEQFPHVSLWVPNRLEGIAIASMEPLSIDVDQLRAKLKVKEVHEDLDSYGLGSAEAILGTFVAADEALSRTLGAGPTITDDRPRIEYFSFSPSKLIDAEQVAAAQTPIDRYLTGSFDSAAIKRQQDVVKQIWRQHDAFQKFVAANRGRSPGAWESSTSAGKSDIVAQAAAEAAEHTAAGLKLDPTNRYLLYLKATLEDELQKGMDSQRE